MRVAIKATMLTLAALMVAMIPAPAAQASYGLDQFDVSFSGPNGEGILQAAAHPYAMTTFLHLNGEGSGSAKHPAGSVKDLEIAQIPGFIGDQTAVPTCSTLDFLTLTPGNSYVPECSDSSAVGIALPIFGVGGEEGSLTTVPLYFLEPAPGSAARLGFYVSGVPITIDISVAEEPPYDLVVHTRNISQTLEFYGAEVTLWGVPADPRHGRDRGVCGGPETPTNKEETECPPGIAVTPFLTLPTTCREPLATSYASDSWQSPGSYLSNGAPDLGDSNWVTGSVLTHDEAANSHAMVGCASLPFAPLVAAQPTAKAASSPTGLDFSIDINDEGLKNANEGARAASQIEKAIVTLPEGMTPNPALAEGLATCTEVDLASENAKSASGEGCPDASKIGTVEVTTPLLSHPVGGALYIATPYENPEHSLLALYIVLKDRELGLSIKQPLRVEPDPLTGQLTTVAEDMPQLPFSHFRLHFREGARSPLATPPACGTYTVNALLYPSSGGAPASSSSSFQIISGPDAGPCPTGGLPPFHPELSAGTLNNAAGHFSPFNLRLSRTDSEQEITHFSIKLPPGITGKLAGIPYCSDAAIAAATARTGPHGGREELEHPSCPAASEVGRTLAGAGVGPSLAYAPGKVYLAGPYHGSNLSVVAITAGVVGPFDIGTVVIRQALKIDPETAEVFIDSTGSDPLPHIVKGIPVHLRDIRAYVDKPNFVLNPTDCTRTSTASTLLGSGLDFGSEADDRPVTVSTPFQAADCAALPFKPKLSLKLRGGTRRGGHPAFSARLKMNGIGEAGIARAEVTLPKSEFIDQSHFITICTRVQFKAGAGNGSQCPAGSVYGKATATTPILGEPLAGPVFLRSSEHQLPDLVVALHNAQVDFDLVGHVDSVKGKLRNTFEAAPDAPVSSFVLEMQGGKKGLFENSTDLCASTHKAESAFTGQNGKRWDTKPVMRVKCGGKGRNGHQRRHSHR